MRLVDKKGALSLPLNFYNNFLRFWAVLGAFSEQERSSTSSLTLIHHLLSFLGSVGCILAGRKGATHTVINSGSIGQIGLLSGR